jgi:hypothetical protein
VEGALRLAGADREEAYRSAKELLIPNWPLLYGWSETSDYNSFGLRELRDWKRAVFRVSSAHSRKALDYLGAGMIVGRTDLPGLLPAGEAAPGTPVTRNPDVLPRWFTVGEGRWAPDKEAAWSWMDLKGVDFSRIAFFDRPEGVGAFATRDVRESPRALNRVDLRMMGWTGRPSLLVSSEAASPGWRVWANGKPARPRLLNQAFRGAILREGDSEVHWSYEPGAFRLGLFLSLVSWAVALGWAVGGRGEFGGRPKQLALREPQG